MVGEKKNKLLIINRAQFGYHIDTYSYCKYAVETFDITYIGFDNNLARIELNNVKCIYVPRQGNLISRYLKLLTACLRECRNNYNIIFIKYFIGSTILKLLNSRKCFILDIRTGSVRPNLIKRKWLDFILKLESCFFKHISVISKSLADKLDLPPEKVHILPLGAEPVVTPSKKFDSIKLLYVGTFDGRRIEDTIEGLSCFYAENKHFIDINYDIIGNGHDQELANLRKLVKKKGLAHIISMPGYIHQNQLCEYYEKCNIGVSYIPINDIYDCQPSTKTFEYLLAGMPVIATATKENSLVINQSNGVLIRDNAESFCRGLKEIYDRGCNYQSVNIRQSSLKNSWQAIVKNNFVNFLNNLVVEKKAHGQ